MAAGLWEEDLAAAALEGADLAAAATEMAAKGAAALEGADLAVADWDYAAAPAVGSEAAGSVGGSGADSWRLRECAGGTSRWCLVAGTGDRCPLPASLRSGGWR